MKKQVADLVRNYVRKLSEDDLVFLHHRLRDRFRNDLAEAIHFIEKSSEMDRWFSTSRSAIDLYDMVDIVHQYIGQDTRLKPVRPRR